MPELTRLKELFVEGEPLRIFLVHIFVGGRELLDVQGRLQHNTENQRLVAREADHLQLEMMAQETKTRMKVGVHWGKVG